MNAVNAAAIASCQQILAKDRAKFDAYEAALREGTSNPISAGNSKLAATSAFIKAQPRTSDGGYLLRIDGAPDTILRGYRVVSFNLPAWRFVDPHTGKIRVVCFGADACTAYCYAGKGAFMFPDAKKVRIATFLYLVELYNRDGFAAVVAQLTRWIDELPRSVGAVRLHDSGDFFAEWYMRAWIEVARRRPDVVFYGYTKTGPVLRRQDPPANFRFRHSVGGKFDAQISDGERVARVFADRLPAGWTDGCDPIIEDAAALSGVERIGLVLH